MLQPFQIVKRRENFPVAYIPIGTIEWHPVGADTLQAEGIAVRWAQKAGGPAFPSLYYGENRLQSLVEATAEDKDLIAKEMNLSVDNFTPKKLPFTEMEQMLNYNRLLLHVLAEVESLGFEVGVFVAGHYPLIDHARASVLMFNKREKRRKDGMLAWAFCDYLLLTDKYKCTGDHG